jgi:hypothetical protein
LTKAERILAGAVVNHVKASEAIEDEMSEMEQYSSDFSFTLTIKALNHLQETGIQGWV